MTDSTAAGGELHSNGSSRDPIADLAQALETLRVDESDPAPVYVQLERSLRIAVADGLLQPGDQLPSVRNLARHLRVSANTVGRAYADPSREGVIVAKAGGGSTVAPLERINLPASSELVRNDCNSLHARPRFAAWPWGSNRVRLQAHSRASSRSTDDPCRPMFRPHLLAMGRFRSRRFAIACGVSIARSSLDRMALEPGARPSHSSR
jgi:DNA-binding transcriptional regulator YhcF (GntR family)